MLSSFMYKYHTITVMLLLSYHVGLCQYFLIVKNATVVVVMVTSYPGFIPGPSLD